MKGQVKDEAKIDDLNGFSITSGIGALLNCANLVF